MARVGVLPVCGFVAAGLLAATAAEAQPVQPCDSCEGCTAVLSRPGARAELSADVMHDGIGPCVVVSGASTMFDGMEREIRSTTSQGSVGIRVEGSGVLVRNAHVFGSDVGIDVSAADATLFHVWVEANGAGIRGNGSSGLRVTRSVVRGGQIGISFGGDAGGRCPDGAALLSPGVVIAGTHVEGARVGIAACEAMPVIRHCAVTRNDVGVVLGRPAPAGDGPEGRNAFDPCFCRPPLEGTGPGVPVMFLSGCPGSEAHKAWLPDLDPRGFRALIRPSAPEEADRTRAFDAFIDRCVPQLTDAIGIPGCVPNYACPADDRTFKVRAGERELSREAELNDPESLFAFWESCRDAAARDYRPGEDCVVNALHDNTICGNRQIDLRSAGGSAGAANACASAEGWNDAGASGCSRPCTEAPAPVLPAPRMRPERAAPPPPPAEPIAADPLTSPVPPVPPEAVAPEAAAPPPAPPAPPADRIVPPPADEGGGGSSGTWLLIAFALLAALVGTLIAMSRRPPAG